MTSPPAAEHGVGHGAHEPDVAAAVDQADVPAGQRRAELRRRRREGRHRPRVGAAEHAQAGHGRRALPRRAGLGNIAAAGLGRRPPDGSGRITPR